MPSAIIEVSNIEKSFEVGSQVVPVLRGVTAKIEMGDFVIIVGPSGCGKSTLLHIILGLEEPSSGTVVFLGENIYNNTTEDYRSDFRKKHIGMVYQQPNWVKSMTVAENVSFPMLLLGMDKESSRARAIELLNKLRMGDWADYMPTELSGGQQQRVSLARALANNPEIIIADEPTGNLDYQTGQEVMQLLQELNTKEKKTVVMVTHDLEYLKYANSAIKIFDGKIDAIYSGSDIGDLQKNSKQKRGVDGIASEIKVDEQYTPSSSTKVVSTKPSHPELKATVEDLNGPQQSAEDKSTIISTTSTAPTTAPQKIVKKTDQKRKKEKK